MKHLQDSFIRTTGPVRLCHPLLIIALFLLAGTVGCGDLKPPTFGELVGNEKGDEESKTPTPRPAANQSQRPKRGDDDSSQADAQPIKKAEPIPEPKPAPEKVMAQLEANDYKIAQDHGLDKLVDSLGDQTNLVTKLDLSGSQVTESGMRVLEKLPELKELDLTNVKLPEPSWEPLAQLTGLEKLNLHRSNITDAGLVHLRGLVHLKELNLSMVEGVTDQGHLNFADYHELEVFDISSNKRITGAGFDGVRRKKGMSLLKELIVNNTQFGKGGYSGLKGLKSLEVLDSGNAGVTNIALGGLRGCKNIKRILLGNNRSIGDNGMVELGRLKKLEYLDIRNALSVSDFGLSQLKGSKQLQFLNVDGTKVTGRGAAALKKRIPELKMRFHGKEYE